MYNINIYKYKYNIAMVCNIFNVTSRIIYSILCLLGMNFVRFYGKYFFLQ